MRKTIIVTTFVASLLGPASIAFAGNPNSVPPIAQTGSFSASVNHVFDVILQPLDAATRPVNDLVKPVTGSPSFAGASSIEPATRDPRAGSTNTNLNPQTTPTSASKEVPVL